MTESRGRSKIRTSRRYDLPLDATVDFHGDSIETTVVDISQTGCRLQGPLPRVPGPFRNSCKVIFSLSDGYSEPLRRILPKKPLEGAITRLRRRNAEGGLGEEYIVEFADHSAPTFVPLLARELHRFPKLSWRVPDSAQHIVDIADRYGHRFGGLTRGRVDRWLAQICDDRWDEQRTEDVRALALDISEIALSHYHYSYEQCLALARKLWQDILHLDGVGYNKDRVRLFPLDIEAKSGHVTLYTMRVANNLPDYICRESFARLESQTEMQRLQNVEWIVLVDDFLGSGRTAKRYLDEFKALTKRLKRFGISEGRNNSQDLLKGKKVALACLVGFFDRARWKKNKDDYPELRQYDEVLVGKPLSIRHDTIHSQYVIPPEKRDGFKALQELANRKRLFVQGGQSRPNGFGDLGALVSFYYSTPNNSLPILWSMSRGWLPLLPKRYQSVWRSLRAPEPQPVPLVDETLRDELVNIVNGGAKTIGIFGRASCGKSNLAAELAKHLAQECCQNVIWHEFGDICSYNSFFCHIGWCLSETFSLGDLKEQYFRGQSTDQLRRILVESLQCIRANILLGGVDRIKDPHLIKLLQDLIRETDNSVRIVLTCRLQDDGRLPQWVEGMAEGSVTIPPLTDDQLIRIFNSVSDANYVVGQPDADLVVHKSCKHPIVAWLLASLYLKEQARFAEIVTSWDVEDNPIESATKNLFATLASISTVLKTANKSCPRSGRWSGEGEAEPFVSKPGHGGGLIGQP